ncbi:MAG TPA: cobalamin-independent methionine synthase II family protein [Candidatus Sulfotelmatobacter sp.]|nr:cobalamin-independent methionine synthase II family protein [Candidatus Sulfotelmatobacter sp.]
MTQRQNRILTTHTGSLPRPEALTLLYAQRSRGETVDEGALTAAGRAALDDVVPRQLAAGIDIPNNGEVQRDSFVLYVRDRMTGLGGSWQRRQRADLERYPMFLEQLRRTMTARPAVDDIGGLPKAIGPIGYPDATAVEAECRDFRAVLDAQATRVADAFLTAPSPGMVSAIARNEFYPDEASYLGALAAALRTEYQTIVAQGFLLQLDCPDLARERHNTYQDRPLAAFLGFVERVVTALNRALDGIPRERVRLHVCWGNYEGPHDCDVPLADIIPILGQAAVGGFVLPFANPRHAHEYRHLRDLLGDDRTIVAGVIDTTTNFVEHPEVVAERLERVAAVVGDPGRVIAGTDCGFETIAGRGRVAEDVVWAKLASLSEGARLASSRLF